MLTKQLSIKCPECGSTDLLVLTSEPYSEYGIVWCECGLVCISDPSHHDTFEAVYSFYDGEHRPA